MTRNKKQPQIPPPDTAMQAQDQPTMIGANAPTSVKEVTARMRERQTIELRITGASFEQIGNTLGITGEGARQACKRALTRTAKETEDGAAVLREIERQRLERMILAVSQTAMRGHIGAVETVRKLSESIRKLQGLDLQGTNVNFNATLNVEGLKGVLDLVYGNANDPS